MPMHTAFTPLSPEHPVADVVCDDITLRYRLLNRTGPVEFLLLPTSRAANTVPRRALAPLHPSRPEPNATTSCYRRIPTRTP